MHLQRVATKTNSHSKAKIRKIINLLEWNMMNDTLIKSMSWVTSNNCVLKRIWPVFLSIYHLVWWLWVDNNWEKNNHYRELWSFNMVLNGFARVNNFHTLFTCCWGHLKLVYHTQSDDRKWYCGHCNADLCKIQWSIYRRCALLFVISLW